MDYQYFANKLGAKFDIVNGELVESVNGLFIVSDKYTDYVIYLNKLTKTASIVAPQKSFLGRSYRLRHLDCITLFAEWLDDHYGSTWGNIYNKLSNREFYRYYKSGMSLWYEDNGFTQVEKPKHGDCLVYAYKPKVISHVGICLDGDKILHHLPYKLSSIDSIEPDKIIGVYRYGN